MTTYTMTSGGYAIEMIGEPGSRWLHPGVMVKFSMVHGDNEMTVMFPKSKIKELVAKLEEALREAEEETSA